MSHLSAQLRRDALQIWRAGVEAVLPSRLVPQWLRVEKNHLVIGGETISLDAIRHIAVVGAGKAGAGMAEAVETALGQDLIADKQLVGWVNVPADCIRGKDNRSGERDSPIFAKAKIGTQDNRSGERDSPIFAKAKIGTVPCAKIGTVPSIHLHAARPAGVNEPTPEGVRGSIEILRLVESLGPEDLCICLISGGGSALLPAPVEGISLADKLAVTRHLSAAGANIEQLNTVRKQLSQIKGGGLLRACRAGRLVSLIISDVLGDPLDLIASGPTVPDPSTPQAALEVLEQFSARSAGISPAVFEVLKNASSFPFSRRVHAAIPPGEDAGAKRSDEDAGAKQSDEDAGVQQYVNYVIGNNATAVAAAGKEAARLGYEVVSETPRCWGGSSTATPTYQSAIHSEGQAEDIGRVLAERAIQMRDRTGPTCRRPLNYPSWGGSCTADLLRETRDGSTSAIPTCAFISGGEPVVTLAEPSRRGLGGRNQQLVLAALLHLIDDGAEGIVLLSGGTDGEDGPTDAAGALLDAGVLAAARQRNLDPSDFLARNDAYRFFAPLDALLKTGPTQTNVCDVRVVLAHSSPRRHEDTKKEELGN